MKTFLLLTLALAAIALVSSEAQGSSVRPLSNERKALLNLHENPSDELSAFLDSETEVTLADGLVLNGNDAVLSIGSASLTIPVVGGDTVTGTYASCWKNAFDLSGVDVCDLKVSYTQSSKAVTISFGLDLTGALSGLSSVITESTVSVDGSYEPGTWTLSGSTAMSFSGMPLKSGELSLSCTYSGPGSFQFEGSVSLTITIGATEPTFGVKIAYDTDTKALELEGTVGGCAQIVSGVNLCDMTATVNLDLTKSGSSALESIVVSGQLDLSGALSGLTSVISSAKIDVEAAYAPGEWSVSGTVAMDFSDFPLEASSLSLSCTFSDSAFTFEGSLSLTVKIDGSSPQFDVTVTYAQAEKVLDMSGSVAGCVSAGSIKLCDVTIAVSLDFDATQKFRSLTMSGTIDCSDALGPLGDMLSSLSLQGSVALQAADAGGYEIEISMGVEMTFKPNDPIIGGSLSLFLIMGLGYPKLEVGGTVALTAKLGNDPANYPEFFVTISYNVITFSLTIRGGMNNCWAKPFGINGLTVCDLVLGVTITAGYPPVITGFEAGGTIRLGSGSSAKQFLVYLRINVLEPTENAFTASFQGTLSLFDLISFAMTLAGGSQYVNSANVFPMSISNVEVTLAAMDFEYGGVTYSQGFHFGGTLSIFGVTFDAKFSLSSNGVEAYLAMTPLSFGGGLLKVQRSSSDASNGPFADFKATFSPQEFEVEASGYAYLLGFGVDIQLSITTTRYYFSASIKYLNLFQASLAVEASFGDVASASFMVEAIFQNDLFNDIRAKAKAAIQQYADDAERAINDAKAEVARAQADVDSAQRDVLSCKADVDAAKREFDSANNELTSAQNDVNSLCSIRHCGGICAPTTWWDGCCWRTASWCTGCVRCGGWSCRWRGCCVRWGGHCIGCLRTNWCGTRITDPVCLLANEGCQLLRNAAYAVLEVAKAVVSATRETLNVANYALDAAAATMETANAALTVADGTLTAVNEVNKVGAQVAGAMANFFLGGVFDVSYARFYVSLSAANGGRLDITVKVSFMGSAPTQFSLYIDFRNILSFANALWDKVKAVFTEENQLAERAADVQVMQAALTQARADHAAAVAELQKLEPVVIRHAPMADHEGQWPFYTDVVAAALQETIAAHEVEDVNELINSAPTFFSELVDRVFDKHLEDVCAALSSEEQCILAQNEAAHSMNALKLKLSETLMAHMTSSPMTYNQVELVFAKWTEIADTAIRADTTADHNEVEKFQGLVNEELAAAESRAEEERKAAEEDQIRIDAEVNAEADETNAQMQALSEDAVARIAEIMGDSSEESELSAEQTAEIQAIRDELDAQIKALEEKLKESADAKTVVAREASAQAFLQWQQQSSNQQPEQQAADEEALDFEDLDL